MDVAKEKEARSESTSRSRPCSKCGSAGVTPMKTERPPQHRGESRCSMRVRPTDMAIYELDTRRALEKGGRGGEKGLWPVRCGLPTTPHLVKGDLMRFKTGGRSGRWQRHRPGPPIMVARRTVIARQYQGISTGVPSSMRRRKSAARCRRAGSMPSTSQVKNVWSTRCASRAIVYCQPVGRRR